jgi:SAM-dependent methyltransferase
MPGRPAFRSELLPLEHFHERFNDDNLAFWLPLIVRLGEIRPGQRVLDAGCGTGGFTRAIAEATDATVVGVDRSEEFVAFAAAAPAPARGGVEWVVADLERLPPGLGEFDRMVFSLVLHQLADPAAAIAEARRVAARDAVVLVRTIAPEDAAGRVPARYLPSMAAADVARLPPLAAIEGWLADAGFVLRRRERVLRNHRLDAAAAERRLRVDVASRYRFVPADELEEAVRRLRRDAAAQGDAWIDPRPTYFLVAASAAE